jgi:hypothetical protein
MFRAGAAHIVLLGPDRIECLQQQRPPMELPLTTDLLGGQVQVIFKSCAGVDRTRQRKQAARHSIISRSATPAIGRGNQHQDRINLSQCVKVRMVRMAPSDEAPLAQQPAQTLQHRHIIVDHDDECMAGAVGVLILGAGLFEGKWPV